MCNTTMTTPPNESRADGACDECKHGSALHVLPMGQCCVTECGCPKFTAPSTEAPASEANNYHDAYRGARDDLLDWKHRALTAEDALRKEQETSANLADALAKEVNGPTFMGEPAPAGGGEVRRYGLVGVAGGGLAGCKNGCLSSASMMEQRGGAYVLASDYDAARAEIAYWKDHYIGTARRLDEVLRELAALRAPAEGKVVKDANYNDGHEPWCTRVLTGDCTCDGNPVSDDQTVCHNCDTPVPPGCGGLFNDDGLSCALFRSLAGKGAGQ